MLSITELPRNWQPTHQKQDNDLVLNDSANVGTVHCSRVAASCLLVSVFIHLFFGLRVIRYTLYKLSLITSTGNAQVIWPSEKYPKVIYESPQKPEISH